jgi:hypothetical protein
MGGIINEKDYNSILARAYNKPETKLILISQAKTIARVAGIPLLNEKTSLDPRITLYGIMRSDKMPNDVQFHHCQMCDQRLFAEALRMIGDETSLEILASSLPHIEI